MAKRQGPGQKTTRPARMNNVPREDDLQTDVEIKQEAGGGKRTRPASKSIGATKRRVEGGTGSGRRTAAREAQGSDVAPTPRAVARERARHAAERKVGRQAAGTAGRKNPRGSSAASRSQLDAAARRADRSVARRDVPSRASGGASALKRRSSVTSGRRGER